MKDKKTKQKKKRTSGYVIGSLIVSAGAILVVPKIVSKFSSYIYNKSIEEKQGININADTDDWGPVIEKKSDSEQ